MPVPGLPLFRALRDAARVRYAARPQQAFEVRLPFGDERRLLFARTHNRALSVPPVVVPEIKLLAWSRAQAGAVEAQLAEGRAVADGVPRRVSVGRIR